MKLFPIAILLLGILLKGMPVFSQNNQEKKNILMIVFDDLRPLIGAYGEPDPLTPNLDAFAKDAVRFNRAYVNYPICSPSRAAMITGVRFDYYSKEKKKKLKFDDMIASQQTWPTILKENGYWTATRGKIYHGDVPKSEKSSWHIPGNFWINKGSRDGDATIKSKIVEIGGDQKAVQKYMKKTATPSALIYASVDGPDDLLNDGKTTNDVVDYIKNKRDKSKPFAIACGFGRPHLPWVAPKKYFDMYPEDAGTLAYFPKGTKKSIADEFFSDKHKSAGWNEGMDDETSKKLIRGYMASSTFVDAQMGKVIKALKDEGLYEDTIIIVWGDHGYHLTDHGLWRKGTGYNVALRSPLMIKTPSVTKPKVVEHVVQNIDIYPTILELAGIEQPKSIGLKGHSLVPLIDQKNPKWNHFAYTCAKQSYGVVTDKYRFTKTQAGDYHLYDLEKDPEEWNNLAKEPKYQKLVKELETKMNTVVLNKP